MSKLNVSHYCHVLCIIVFIGHFNWCWLWKSLAIFLFVLAFATFYVALLTFNSSNSCSDNNSTQTVGINKYPILLDRAQSVSSIEIYQPFPSADAVSICEIPCSSMPIPSSVGHLKVRQIQVTREVNKSRYGFNYYGHNNSITLPPGSKITYYNISSNDMTPDLLDDSSDWLEDSSNSTVRCLRLILMNSQEAYNEFLNLPDYYNFTTYVNHSHCQDQVEFEIKEVQSTYFVGIEIPKKISSISGSVTVSQMYFENSNFKSVCKNLSADFTSYSVTICNKWVCLGNKQSICIFANSTSPDKLTVHSYPILFGGRVSVYLMITSMVFVTLSFVCLACGLVKYVILNCKWKCCSRRKTTEESFINSNSMLFDSQDNTPLMNHQRQDMIQRLSGFVSRPLTPNSIGDSKYFC